MQLSRLLVLIALFLVPASLLGTTWLYLYPLFQRCDFPTPSPSSLAPFRLLALGDPQLEGDSSLPDPDAPTFPSLRYLAEDVRNAGSWRRRRYFISQALRGVGPDLAKWLEGYRKRLDLWGNDLYLAHIVRTLRWWTTPTHVAVLGDLLGSQWIDGDEFERRAARYWGTVFRGLERVPEGIMVGEQNEDGGKTWGSTVEVLGADKSWENRVINIAGNHDIGYAGDLDEDRIARFEKAFGAVNWDVVFTLPTPSQGASPFAPNQSPGIEVESPDDQSGSSHHNDSDPPALRLVILNSMNLDTPAYSASLQQETYNFLNHIITTSRPVTDKSHFTVLLTHIPLEKAPGICVDAPFFDFFDAGSGSGVKEQNMLSDHASKIVLESIFGLSGNKDVEGHGFGRRGVVLNGHDHEGCDVLHWTTQPGVESCPGDGIDMKDVHVPPNYLNASDASLAEDSNSTVEDIPDGSAKAEQLGWSAIRYPHLPYKLMEDGQCVGLSQVPRMREITLRSMMGDFGGYAGLLSVWFRPEVGEKGEWKMDFRTCSVGVQHWWWAVHIVDLVALGFLVAALVVRAVEMSWGAATEKSVPVVGKTGASMVRNTGTRPVAVGGMKGGDRNAIPGKGNG